MLPVVVTDSRAENLARQVKAILEVSRMSQSEPARRGIEGVASLREFVNLMPFLVAQAEREYIRHGLIQPSTAEAGSRSRLGDHDDAPKPTLPSQQQEEYPAKDGSANGRPDV